MEEKFAVKQDPNNRENWGIIWVYSGTEGGFKSEEAARKSAIKQGGIELSPEESKVFEW